MERPQEDRVPTDGRPDPRLHHWLASRIDGSIAGEGEEEPTRDEGTGPLDRARPNWAPDEDELETVRATPFSDEDGTMDDAPLDPATTRVHQLPLSFIGESVIDPVTRNDSHAVAALWRDETVRRNGNPPKDPSGAPTMRLRQGPGDGPTVRLRRASGQKRLSAPVEQVEEFPIWDYLVFAIGMLAVFVCAFGVATWYWVL
jgi:hypothetical protein